MLVYKCDGESFSTGKKCEREVENELPARWLIITGNIKNGLYDAHYIECNGTRHFCSRRCLENFLFKDVNPASGKAGVNNMLDPKDGQEEVKGQPADAVAPKSEQAAEKEQVPGEAKESEGEGTPEG